MSFPDTIDGFGLHFNEEGKLRNKETGKPFEFCVKENDQTYNQRRYEALGELITPHIYNLLESKCNLEKHPVPVNAEKDDPQTFIFASKDFREKDKLMILIHGSGVVKAGQWARRLIINDSLNSGSQIPFIERAQKENYAVLVTNTNHNFFTNADGDKVSIKGSQNPEEHGLYVWKNYVQKCKATKIFIVAHSFGGVVTVNLYRELKREFDERVVAIAMTDSVHYGVPSNTNILKIARNWVTSTLPVNAPVERRYGADVTCFSAGCSEHEMTSWSSFESIFEFFDEKTKELENDVSDTDYPLGKKQKTDNEEGSKNSQEETELPKPEEV